jgi:hypothetical protein
MINKLLFLIVFFIFSSLVFSQESTPEIQYKKEIANAANLKSIFLIETWNNVKFKNKNTNTIKKFVDFSDFEKHTYVLIVGENTSRTLSNLEKVWKEKEKTNENFDGLKFFIDKLHDERRNFSNAYLDYAKKYTNDFYKELTEEEAVLITKQIKDFSIKENLN